MRLVAASEQFDQPRTTAERKLLVAMLKRAVLDLCSENSEESEQARAWFYSDDDSDEEFTFPWVCEQLGLNAAEVGGKLQGLGDDTPRREMVMRFLPRTR